METQAFLPFQILQVVKSLYPFIYLKPEKDTAERSKVIIQSRIYHIFNIPLFRKAQPSLLRGLTYILIYGWLDPLLGSGLSICNVGPCFQNRIWKRLPFWADPPHIGCYRVSPPPFLQDWNKQLTTEPPNDKICFLFYVLSIVCISFSMQWGQLLWDD